MKYLCVFLLAVMAAGCRPDPFGEEMGVDSSDAKSVYTHIASEHSDGTLHPALTFVTGLHAYARAFQDHIYVMKFQYTDRAPVEALIQRYHLQNVDQPEHGLVRFSSEMPPLRWWTPPDNATIYSSGDQYQRYITLWDVEESKTVFYQDFSN